MIGGAQGHAYSGPSGGPTSIPLRHSSPGSHTTISQEHFLKRSLTLTPLHIVSYPMLMPRNMDYMDCRVYDVDDILDHSQLGAGVAPLKLGYRDSSTQHSPLVLGLDALSRLFNLLWTPNAA